MSEDGATKEGDSAKPAGSGDKLAARRAREAEALKRNLARRKAQARRRQSPPEGDSER